jgi:hypothetical protein
MTEQEEGSSMKRVFNLSKIYDFTKQKLMMEEE